MKFFKSIRFKLTLWYSLLLISLSLVFIVTINLFITMQYRRDPIETFLRNKPHFLIRMDDLDDTRIQIIEEYRQNDLNAIRKLSLISFVPLIFFSFAGGYFISDQMLTPLKKLNTKMTMINAKNLKSKIRYEKTDDEISELIENFNNMIKRLDKSFELQKQFVENASHELKTPLTIIQTNLESALSENRITKKEYEDTIEVSLKSTKFMNKLIEDLLLLSLLENHVIKRNINLRDVVKESINEINVIAKKKSLKIKFEYEKKNKYKINANNELLQRAIMNILENSIKYSNRKSNIFVNLIEKKNYYIIKIADEGIGIPKNEIKKVFDRFYRVDKSRSRKTGGTGLGLSIAKKVISLHNGTIEITSSPTKGTTVKMKLPK